MLCRMKLVESVLEEVQNAIEDSEGEIERLLEIEKQNLLGTCSGAECSQCQEHGRPPALSINVMEGIVACSNQS